MPQPKTVKELAEYLGGVVRGDETCRISGLAPLESAGPSELTFITHAKYLGQLASSCAG